MSKFITSLEIILPLLVPILVGIIFRAKQLLDDKGVDAIKLVVTKLIIPAIVLGVLMDVKYKANLLLIFVLMYAVHAIIMGVFWKNKKHPLLKFLLCSFEAGTLAYPMFPIVFGGVPSADIGAFAIIDIGCTIFIFTTYILLVKSDEKSSGKQMFKSTITDPVVIAVILGMTLGMLNINENAPNVAKIVESVANFSAVPGAVLVLITIGYTLDFKGEVVKKALCYAGLRFIVMAIMGTIFYMTLGLITADKSVYLYPTIMMFSLPTTYMLPVVQKNPHDKMLASTTISISTLIFFAVCIFIIVQFN